MIMSDSSSGIGTKPQQVKIDPSKKPTVKAPAEALSEEIGLGGKKEETPSGGDILDLALNAVNDKLKSGIVV
jgi:hypothetical protein